jgi:hypothetical protein
MRLFEWLWLVYERLMDRAADMRQRRLARDRELGRPPNQRLERLSALARRQHEKNRAMLAEREKQS